MACPGCFAGSQPGPRDPGQRVSRACLVRNVRAGGARFSYLKSLGIMQVAGARRLATKMWLPTQFGSNESPCFALFFWKNRAPSNMKAIFLSHIQRLICQRNAVKNRVAVMR